MGLDGVLEGELAALVDDVAQPLVGRGPLVGGGGGRGEPALVDPAAVGPQGVEVLGGQLEPAAGHQERSRDPGRGQPQDTFARVERRADARRRCADRSSVPISRPMTRARPATRPSPPRRLHDPLGRPEVTVVRPEAGRSKGISRDRGDRVGLPDGRSDHRVGLVESADAQVGQARGPPVRR